MDETSLKNKDFGTLVLKIKILVSTSVENKVFGWKSLDETSLKNKDLSWKQFGK